MYINDVHILWYLAIGILGGIVGQIVDWCNSKFLQDKRLVLKEFLEDLKKGVKLNYKLIIVTAAIYLASLYICGIQNSIQGNLGLIQILIITPMLICAFVVDYKIQIIPNRLNLTLFEVGLVFTFIYGVTNLNIAINSLLGMLIGGGIFLLITIIGGLIAGKEAMGFGDVKLMGALGLYFGAINIVAVTIIAFLIGAIISVILLVTKIRKTDEYIPFGPFIVIASFIVAFVPFNILLKILLTIFTLGMFKG